MDEFAEWSEGVFGDAELGDVRRTSRLVLMAKQAARRPSGKVSEVYDSASERQGAYDFIESRHGTAKATGDAMARSTARRCAEHDWVYVPLDGTSVKVWDGTGRKNFGAIGTYRNGAKGLKVNNALALTPDGVPVGIAAQVWWSRPRRPVKKHTHRNRQPLKSKETQHLLTCIDRVVELHKTWKTGACNVESTQLHSSERVVCWATLLIAVAARIERLKRLARASPNLSATEELTESEIEALVLLKRSTKKKTEQISDNPTIAQATLWIAELGGYTGKSSGGPPGSITIARGLERLGIAAKVVALQKLR